MAISSYPENYISGAAGRSSSVSLIWLKRFDKVFWAIITATSAAWASEYPAFLNSSISLSLT
jgi:hypothetical protein